MRTDCFIAIPIKGCLVNRSAGINPCVHSFKDALQFIEGRTLRYIITAYIVKRGLEVRKIWSLWR